MQTYRRAVLFLAVVIAMLLQGVAAATKPEEFILQEKPQEEITNLATPIAKVDAQAGVSITFVAIPGPQGSVAGVAVMTRTSGGQAGLDGVPRLNGANALEIYNAVSKPGSRIPQMLLDLYGRPTLGKQGWALPLPLAGGGTQSLSCMVGSDPFNVVKSDVESKGYGMLFLSEADGPATQPSHWQDDNGPADGTIRRKLVGAVNGAEVFYSRVSYCFEDHDGYPLAFHGRFVSVKVRISNFLPAWTLYDLGSLEEPGDDATFSYSPANGLDYDFRLEISTARPLDQFHIGATWSDIDGDLTIGQ